MQYQLLTNRLHYASFYTSKWVEVCSILKGGRARVQPKELIRAVDLSSVNVETYVFTYTKREFTEVPPRVVSSAWSRENPAAQCI